jgi:hypothetical protein
VDSSSSRISTASRWTLSNFVPYLRGLTSSSGRPSSILTVPLNQNYGSHSAARLILHGGYNHGGDPRRAVRCAVRLSGGAHYHSTCRRDDSVPDGKATLSRKSLQPPTYKAAGGSAPKAVYGYGGVSTRRTEVVLLAHGCGADAIRNRLSIWVFGAGRSIWQTRYLAAPSKGEQMLHGNAERLFFE